MKKILGMFKPNTKKERTKESIYPPQKFVDIMEKSIASKRTSLEEMQPSQMLFHSNMVIPKVLPKSEHERVFAKIDGIPEIENHSLRHQKHKNLLSDHITSSVENDKPNNHELSGEQSAPIVNTSSVKPEPVITFASALQNTAYGQNPWVSPGTVIHINGHTIDGGLFYYGEDEGHIDFSSEVTFSTNPQERVEGITTTTYSNLSKEHKGDYLSWLSGNRDLTNQQMWCIELYVYTLESKILFEYTQETPQKETTILIYKELGRINSIRTLDTTFKSRLSNLLWVILNLKQNKPQQLSGYNERPDNFENVIWANKMAKQSIHLDTTNLLKWYGFNSEVTGFETLRTTSAIGKLILDGLYAEMFSSKLSIPNDILDVVIINYPPINPNTLALPLTSKIIDFTHSNNLFEKITSLILNFNKTISDIIGTETDDEIIELLLINSFKGNELSKLPFDKKLRSLLKEIDVNNRPVTVDIYSLIKVINAKNLTKENLANTLPLLSNILYRYNYQLVPNYINLLEFSGFKKAAVYKHNNEVINLDPDALFDIANTIRVVFYNLRNHQNIDYSICTFAISKHLNSTHTENSSLDYRLYIEALVLWISEIDISKKSYLSIVNPLSKASKLQAADLIITACLSASKFDEADFSKIKVYFSLCGFPKEEIERKIKQIDLKLNPNAYALDHKSINQIQSDTDAVQKELSDIFSEEVDTPTLPAAIKSDVDKRYPGLNASLTSIFQKIITKSKWDAAEFNLICSEYDVLPNGAVETINDWAFDTINTTLIEDDLSIDKELLEELLGELND